MGGRASIALLVNPTNPYTASEMRTVQATAGALGLQLHVLNATGEQDLAAVFAGVAEMRRGAILVGADARGWPRRHRDRLKQGQALKASQSFAQVMVTPSRDRRP